MPLQSPPATSTSSLSSSFDQSERGPFWERDVEAVTRPALRQHRTPPRWLRPLFILFATISIFVILRSGRKIQQGRVDARILHNKGTTLNRVLAGALRERLLEEDSEKEVGGRMGSHWESKALSPPSKFPEDDCRHVEAGSLRSIVDNSHFPYTLPRQSRPFDSLPYMGWLIVMTSDYITSSGSRTLSQLTCYASRIGLPLYIETEALMDDRHFFSARHRSTLKHLPNHQWLMVTDGDLIVSDSTFDPRTLLQSFVKDSPDISLILSDRDDGEVMAGFYILKNQPSSYAFISNWISWVDPPIREFANADNSDLPEMLLSGSGLGGWNVTYQIGRPAAATLKKASSHAAHHPVCVNEGPGWTSFYKFQLCFTDAVKEARGERKKQYWDLELWPEPQQRGQKDLMLPVQARIMKPFSSMIRIGEGTVSCHWELNYYSQPIPGDFLITGKKLDRWITKEMVQCLDDWNLADRPGAMKLHDARMALVSQGYPNYWGCWTGPRGDFDCDEEVAAANKVGLGEWVPWVPPRT